MIEKYFVFGTEVPSIEKEVLRMHWEEVVFCSSAFTSLRSAKCQEKTVIFQKT